MFTIIITLLLPLVSIGIWRQSILKNNKKSGQSVTIGKGEYVLRYLTCLLCMLVIPWILLSLTGNDGNTILRKLLESREYAVKVLCLEIITKNVAGSSPKCFRTTVSASTIPITKGTREARWNTGTLYPNRVPNNFSQ